MDTLLLVGGQSGERLVSVATSQNLAAALPDSLIWFWAEDGGVYPLRAEELRQHRDPFRVPLLPQGRHLGVPLARGLQDLGASLPSGTGRPVVVLGLHGVGGEDGVVQGWLEAAGLPFTGSSSTASALAFDKVRAKEAARRAGIPVADGRVLDGAALSPQAFASELAALFTAWGPFILKPVADGSSVGLQFVRTQEDLTAATARRGADRVLLAEPLLEGVELTCAVLDIPADYPLPPLALVHAHEGRIALPPSEVRVEAGRNFDYDGKYLGKGTQELTPAEVSPADFLRAQELALAAHSAVGAYGYSRTDMILTSKGPVFLEINTLPGLTSASFVPQQLRCAGLPFEDFVRLQCLLARGRSAFTRPIST